MSFDADTYYKIEAYLSGGLNPAESAAFDQQLSTDPILQAEVEKHSIANALIIEQRLLSVKNILQEVKAKDSGSSKPYLLLAVAAVIIAIGISFFVRNKEKAAGPLQHIPSAVTEPVKEQDKEKREDISSSAVTADQPKNPSSDNGFHKQAIQQIEQGRNLAERTATSTDTAATVIQKMGYSVTATEKQSLPENTQTDPCTHVSIKATIKSIPACTHAANGNILVQNIQGGTKPYSISFSTATKEWVRNGELAKGVYQVLITDATNCIQEFPNIRMEEKECPLDDSFNPFTGEKWHLDAYPADGRLEIYNKGGVLYYQATIESQTETEWSGMGTGNQILPGYYIFVLKYTDGTVKKGSVTIVQ